MTVQPAVKANNQAAVQPAVPPAVWPHSHQNTADGKCTACNSVKKLTIPSFLLEELTVIFARPWNRKDERTSRNSESRGTLFEIYLY
jgi:hypothetical protein